MLNTKFWLFVFIILTTILPLAGKQVVLELEVQVGINAPITASEGESVEIEVYVSSVNNLDTAFFVMSYDDSVLEYVSVKAGTLTIGANITVGTTNSGELKPVLNMPGIDGVSGEGTIAVFTFDVVGSAITFTDVTLSEVLLGNNKSQKIPSIVEDSVRLIVDDGRLIFGDVSNNGNVTAYDASLVLQYNAGIRQFLQKDLLQADVNCDKIINAMDAHLILQAAVSSVQLPQVKR